MTWEIVSSRDLKYRWLTPNSRVRAEGEENDYSTTISQKLQHFFETKGYFMIRVFILTVHWFKC